MDGRPLTSISRLRPTKRFILGESESGTVPPRRQFGAKGPTIQVKVTGFDGEVVKLRVRVPNKEHMELFGMVNDILGGSKFDIICEDGKSRMGRVPGKFRKRMWCRKGDLVIIKPWEFDNGKCDIQFRYLANQKNAIEKRNMLPEFLVSLL